VSSVHLVSRRFLSEKFFVSRPNSIFLADGAVEDIKKVIVALQPVVLVLIVAIAYKDGQAMKAEANKPQMYAIIARRIIPGYSCYTTKFVG
jgi:hypothetical protein